MVYLNLNHAMWTADMKAFVLGLIPKAFPDNPPNLDQSHIRHQSSSNYCEVKFPTKQFAERFISWVSSHPNTVDTHSNAITMFAKFSSSPKERAMGRLLTAAFQYIESHACFDAAVMKLSTNRGIGTLSVRYKGLAHIILQVVVSRSPGSAPVAKRGKMVANDIPGFTSAILDKAVQLANEAISERFSES